MVTWRRVLGLVIYVLCAAPIMYVVWEYNKVQAVPVFMFMAFVGLTIFIPQFVRWRAEEQEQLLQDELRRAKDRLTEIDTLREEHDCGYSVECQSKRYMPTSKAT